MKNISKIDNHDEFFKFFEKVNDGDSDIVVWQLDEHLNKRNIYKATLEEFESRSEEMSYCSEKDEQFSFLPGDIYFYIESESSIFKSEQVSIQNNYLTVKFPTELKQLEKYDDSRIKTAFIGIEFNIKQAVAEHDSSVEQVNEGSAPVNREKKTFNVGTDKIETKWSSKANTSQKDIDLFEEELSFITLDEEDKQFEEARETPRARPPEGKLAVIQVADGSRVQASFPLHDLSRGGLSFLVFSKEDFAAGEFVHVKAFDTRTFDNPMYGIVRSIREADEMGIQYKVGVQFIDEEEGGAEDAS